MTFSHPGQTLDRHLIRPISARFIQQKEVQRYEEGSNLNIRPRSRGLLGRGTIVLNPETGTTTQGETSQEAIQKLKEATSLYLDEFPMTIHHHPVMTTFEVSHA